MNRILLMLSLGWGLAAALPPLWAQVPGIISYQGHIMSDEGNFDGTGYFKYALVNQDGPEGMAATYWSNDESSLNGSEPAEAVEIGVDQGLFNVLLGDTALEHMTAIPPEVFSHSEVFLRVWFADDPLGPYTQWADQRISAVGYAMMAASVQDGAITGAKIAPGTIDASHLAEGVMTGVELADGSVTTPKLADQAVTSAKLAGDIQVDHLEVGDDDTHGILDVFNATMDHSAIRLSGFTRSMRVKGENGLELAVLDAGNGGRLRLDHADGQSGLLFEGPGSKLSLLHANADVRIAMEGLDGTMSFFDPAGIPTVNAIGPDGDLIALNRVGVAPLVNWGATMQAALERNGDGGLVRTWDEGKRRTALMGSGKDGGFLQLFRGGRSGTPSDPVDPLEGEEIPVIILDADGGANDGGVITVKQFDGQDGAVLYGNAPNGASGGGALSLRNNLGESRWRAYGGPRGMLLLYNDHTNTVNIDAGATSGSIWVNNKSGHTAVGLLALNDAHGVVSVENQDGEERVFLSGDNIAGSDAGLIGLKNSNGDATILLDADKNGEGRITTDVLEITGGSDLSEQFEVTSPEAAPEPGMLVSIDPARPGQLTLSARAYDRTVAGVISGAGGVKPGMLMGQPGTLAHGAYPVALTGRVYCQVDAQYGAIKPGDLITTSDTPGHGMKAAENDRAQGALVGKAMTPLSHGRGLVLVLVSLH